MGTRLRNLNHLNLPLEGLFLLTMKHNPISSQGYIRLLNLDIVACLMVALMRAMYVLFSSRKSTFSLIVMALSFLDNRSAIL